MGIDHAIGWPFPSQCGTSYRIRKDVGTRWFDGAAAAQGDIATEPWYG